MNSDEKNSLDLGSKTLQSDIMLHSDKILCPSDVDMREYFVVVEDKGRFLIDYTALSNYVNDSKYLRHFIDDNTASFVLFKFDMNLGYYREMDLGKFMENLIVAIKTAYPQLRQMPTMFKTHVCLDVIPFIPMTDEVHKTEEYLALEMLYTDGEVIPFKNGFYSMRYNRFLPRTSCKFVLNPLEVDFNPDALKCNISKKYMEMMDDEICFEYLFEQLGYAIYATTFIVPTYSVLYGNGANGKSVVVDAVTRIVGENNISRISLEDMTNPHIVAQAENKRMNLLVDSGAGYRESAFKSISAVPSFMKTASAGEIWTFNPKYKAPHPGIAPSKFIFASNNYLNFGDSTDGTNRRLHAIPFNQTFEEDYGIILRFKGKEETEWFAMQALVSFKNMINNAMKGEEDIPEMPLKGKYINCDAGKTTKVEMMVNNNIIEDYISNVLGIDILDKEAVREGMDGLENMYLDLKAYCDEVGRKCVSQTKMTQHLKSSYKLMNVRTSYLHMSEIRYKYVIRRID